jgi:hypothetical protein
MPPLTPDPDPRRLFRAQALRAASEAAFVDPLRARPAPVRLAPTGVQVGLVAILLVGGLALRIPVFWPVEGQLVRLASAAPSMGAGSSVFVLVNELPEGIADVAGTDTVLLGRLGEGFIAALQSRPLFFEVQVGGTARALLPPDWPEAARPRNDQPVQVWIEAERVSFLGLLWRTR